MSVDDDGVSFEYSDDDESDSSPARVTRAARCVASFLAGRA